MVAAATDLTLLATLKTYINVGSNSDDMLQRMLSAASVAIENYLNRDIVTQTYISTFDGNDSQALSLPDYPITAVSAVSVNGLAIPSASGSFTTAGFRNTDTQIILNGYRFCKGHGNISVSYTAGYGTAALGTIPYDLEQACVGLVQYWLGDRARNGEVSRSMAGQTITYSQKDMPEWVKTTINQYRRRHPA